MSAAPRDNPGRRWAPLPRGRHRLPRAFVVSNQRERMLDSMAEMVSAKGYARVTVTDVTTHAGVSRRTFYDQFADKEACFLAAFAAIAEQLLRISRLAREAAEAAGQDAPGSWPDGLRRALGACLGLLAAEPAFARMMIIEVLSAGQAALQDRDALLDRLALLLQARAPAIGGPEDDRRLARAVIGGVYETLYERVQAGEVDGLAELLPDLLYCVLVPYVGHTTALAEREATG